MTVQEAYKKVKKKHPFKYGRGCKDYGDFFVFFLAPITIAPNEPYYTGTVYPAVDKKTGRVYDFDISDDPDAFHEATDLKPETFMDKKL